MTDTSNTQTSAITRPRNDLATYVQGDAVRARIAAVLPKHVGLDRFIKVAAVAITKTPGLAKCSQSSFLIACMGAAELGLEINSPLGHAYVVPFKNRRENTTDAQLIIGYRGFVQLARNSGTIASLTAHVVYERDAFEICYGTDEKLVHKPYVLGDPGSVVGAYAVAKFMDGTTQSEFMSLSQIYAIRDRARPRDDSPWHSDFPEMARKTVIRRLAKLLPLSPELARAVEIDEESERAVTVEMLPDDATDVPTLNAGATTALDAMADRIATPADPEPAAS